MRFVGNTMTARSGTGRVLLQHFGGGFLEDYALGASETPGAGGFCVGNTMTVRFETGRVRPQHFGGGFLEDYALGASEAPGGGGCVSWETP